MNVLRQIVTRQDGRLSIEIPKEYQQKRFEVIVLPIDESTDNEQLRETLSAFLATLPDREPAVSEADIIAEIKAVRTTRYGR